MLNKTILGATVIALSLTLAACGSSTTTSVQSETQGQQLIDLKEAYDTGVITEKEYNATKKNILKK
ncbi:MAG: SHOCT domain-containing protein [Halioglobus sp.]